MPGQRRIRERSADVAIAAKGAWRSWDQTGFYEAAPRLSTEAVQLLSAPDCPAGRMDVLLAPDQMMLQIHESIGHPLELDRILGDERNYAGTSFVTPDMFGTYQYGSELLNITFDPSRPEQYASYQFDDDGQPAQKEYLIRNGRLLRGPGWSRLPSAAGPARCRQRPRHHVEQADD